MPTATAIYKTHAQGQSSGLYETEDYSGIMVSILRVADAVYSSFAVRATYYGRHQFASNGAIWLHFTCSNLEFYLLTPTIRQGVGHQRIMRTSFNQFFFF